MNNQVVLSLKNIVKSFQQGRETLAVLHGISCDIHAGEIVSLIGDSGSGKSTLMHIAGLLDRADSGEVLINGQDTSGLTDRARTALRRKSIGFIYQFHHLLAEFSALENVVLPQLADGVSYTAASTRARELLEHLGLSERVQHRPSELSGGEQQRVAIARALANSPSIILADEPTGNLDAAAAQNVFELFLSTARDFSTAILLVTHNVTLARKTDHAYTLINGDIAESR